MKRIVMSIIAVTMTLSLVACGDVTKKPARYIEKAQLSEQEESIAQLLGDEQLIYDFKLDNHVKSIQVNTYELIDGTWKQVLGGGATVFSDNEGRLALKFKNLKEGFEVALQSKQNSGSTQYAAESTEDFTEMARATSILNERTEINYEQEIPLAIQILTTQNTVSSYNVEYFFNPDIYEKRGYEHVYAITIQFSQKTVSELDTKDEQ